MDWEHYKRLCDTPDVASRWLLEQTFELLSDPALRSRLGATLRQPPLPKPADHRGGTATDMFRLALTAEEVCAVCREVEAAVAGGLTTRATRARGLGGFVEAWQEYARYVLAQARRVTDCSPRS